MTHSHELVPWLWSVFGLLEERMTCPVARAHVDRMTDDEKLDLAWREAQDPWLTLPSFTPVGPFEPAAVSA